MSRAAFSTRTIPSTAGRIISFSSFGTSKKTGDATLSKYLQYFMASRQFPSSVNQVSINERLSNEVIPPIFKVSITSFYLLDELKVVLTLYPF